MAEAIRRGAVYLRSRRRTHPVGFVLFHAQLPSDVVALASQAFASAGQDLVDQCRVEAARFGPTLHRNPIDQEHFPLDLRRDTFKVSW